MGFPDINTLEPLAAALGLTVPELMRSRREEAPQPLSDRDVTELLQSAVTMARENQRQDRTATLLAILVTVLAGTPVFLTRHANLSGAYFFGAMAATAAVGAYLYLRNREDRASRRIYGCFLLAGTGLTLAAEGVDSLPINFLKAIPGTPLEGTPPLPPAEALRCIALMRLLNPGREIVICGGREHALGQWQSWVFAAGAGMIMTGDYLTTTGRAFAEDHAMLAALGLRAAENIGARS